MKKFLVLVAFTISCFFVYTLNTNAQDVSIFGASFNYCNAYSGSCYLTDVRYYPNSSIWLTGAQNATDYNLGKYDYISGIRFYSEIVGNSGDIVNLYYVITIDGIREEETYSNSWLNNKDMFYSSSNVNIVSTSLLSNTFKQDSDPTIIDYNPVYLGTQTIKFKVVVSLNQSLNNSSLYVGVGSYTTASNQSSLFVNQHISDTPISFSVNTYEINTSSTIINQNDQIIEQNKITNDKLDNLDTTIKNQTEVQQKNHDETMNTLKDDNTTEASNEASEFFSGFETDTFGLTSIITAPLNLIGSITSSSCSPLGLEVPFSNSTLNLPCMTSIYERYFGSFLDVYQTITFGIIAYWVCVKIFALVKDFKNPDHDEIEVMDL